MWSIVWNVISRLSGRFYTWAVRNTKKVYDWVANGATFEQVKEWIGNIIN
ncbi:aureocin A53 family class IId bacteriocin [Staphylococcus xylosus]